jgi:hypothetical protein
MISQLYPLGHLLLGIAELFLVGWSIRLWLQSKSVAMIVLPVILLGIGYDNLLLATGALIGEGELLQSLSQVRFLVHHLFVPFLIVVGVELAHCTKADWADNLLTRSLAWIISLSLGIFDIFNRYVGAELEPIYFAGVLRYTASPIKGLPIIAIAVTLFVLLIGIGIWIRSEGKWFWLFFGTLVALVGNALPLSMVGTLPGSLSEFVMTLTLILTEQYTQPPLTVVPKQKSTSPIAGI